MLLGRRATVGKGVLEELKEAVEVKLGTLRKQEKEGKGDMDPLVAHKSRMREEVARQMEKGKHAGTLLAGSRISTV